MATPAKAKAKENILADNRKAFHEYEILEKIESGIVLTGPEVKSTRGRQMNLKAGYASIENGQVILKGVHIAPYKPANEQHYNPDRFRTLLLSHKEIAALDKQLKPGGITLIPLQTHLNARGKIKILIGVCKGKKTYDKRQDLKKKAQNLEINRAMKRY